jgi:hypothetical protein
MFNGSEIVEEITTGRLGMIVLSGIAGQPLNRWTVQFWDGRSPIMKDFTDPSALRNLDGPGSPKTPRLVPIDSFI